MSPSRSTEEFYATLGALMKAETDDLRELARIAGVPPEILYAGADLAGIDLTRQDIGFLLPLDVKFESARLTDEQKAAFGRAKRQREKQSRQLEKWRRHVEAFVDEYRATSKSQWIYHLHDELREPLEPDVLSSVMLMPITALGSEFDRAQARSAYCARVIIALAPWAREQNLTFFLRLFTTLKALGVAPLPISIKTLSQSYLPAFGAQLGELLSFLRSSYEVDRWFVIDAASPGERILYASLLSDRRPLDSRVAIEVMEQLDDLRDMLKFLQETHIYGGEDVAEQLAFMLGRGHWSWADTGAVLQADLQAPLFKAVTRQIMEHPDQSRLSRLIEWRDAERGAAGGLSLEALFGAFKDFDIAIRTAEAIAPNLHVNQISAIQTALEPLARREREKRQLRDLHGRARSRVT